MIIKKELKSKVVEIAVKSEKAGLCKSKSGNFSLKDPETNLVYITPSGVSRDDLKLEDIVVVTMDGDIMDSNPDYKPTSELPMHLQAYKCRPDIYGVVHTHSHFATSFAVANKPIKGVVFESLQFGGYAPVAKYGRPGTEELGIQLAAKLIDHDVCLLESHGAIAIGSDIDTAYLLASYLEDVAEIYYRSIVINNGAEPNIIPNEEFEAVLEMSNH